MIIMGFLMRVTFSNSPDHGLRSLAVFGSLALVGVLLLCPLEIRSEELSFDQALNVILENNTSIQMQKTRVTGAEVISISKRTAFLPTLVLSGSQKKVSDISPTTTDTVNSWQAISTLNLFRGGADIEALRAADSDREVQRQSLEASRLTAEQDAIEALISQIEKVQEAEILANEAKVLKNYLGIADQRYKKGFLPLQEVDRVMIDAENAEAKAQDSQSQSMSAQANVSRFLGHHRVEIQWPWKDMISSSRTQILLARDFQPIERPDYRAMQAQVQAEQHRKDQNFGLMLPSLDLSYSYGYLQPVGQGTTRTQTALLSLTIPLFEGLKDYANYREQQQTHIATELKLRQLQNDVLSEWESARNKFKVSLSTVVAREKTLKVAQRLYQANLARFQLGRANANDLQIEQTRMMESELLSLQGWREVHLAFARYCHALGKSVRACE